jgi:hypothetical protein
LSTDTVTNPPNWKYQTDDVLLLPYASENFPDSLLPELYMMCKRDKTIGLIFPGQPKVGMGEFCAALWDKPLLIGISKEEKKILGFAWLHSVEGTENARKGALGFACFREGWGRRRNPKMGQKIRELTRLALGWWFCELGVQILYANTLATNRLTQAFVSEFGFNRIGTLPKFFSRDGALVDSVLFCLDRDAFMGGAG